ncbi:hypothetical protein TWF481_002973 [Arthrobotrys musiformis]|uniref:RlpA-like protein double-psi beta-barrel domain-containing protein n=1 Tax=Arthrobotrys musiformis TaxID=47236 RepID=A0AAV9VSY2_9PEZI
MTSGSITSCSTPDPPTAFNSPIAQQEDPTNLTAPTPKLETPAYGPTSIPAQSPVFRVGFFYGEGTFFDCGLGSCGLTNTNDDYIVAMSKLRMAPLDGINPNNNPLCGKKVRVFSDIATEGVVFTVQDKCPGCTGENDLDVCKGPFVKHLGQEKAGRIKIWWQWVSVK